MTPYQARLAPVVDRAALAAEWRELARRARPPFFLSWDWIGTWIDGLADLEGDPATPWLAQVRNAEGRLVALGLFVETVEIRRRALRVRQLRLHETGSRARDAVTIEYNTLLCDPEREAASWRAVFRALRAPGAPRWDEIIVSGATEETRAILAGLGLPIVTRAATSAAYVDLDALRKAGVATAEDYIATLGKSTRAQLRRALKLYRERGPVTLDCARDADEALAFFEQTGAHHEAKWRARGASGAFSNAAYLAFHRRLIPRAAPHGRVELLRASAGGQPFGWLYNFVLNGRVLFYLSGFAFENDNRLKPGLLTHALAIERALADGHAVYDFMGGADRYKSSLGRPGPGIGAVALQKRVPKLMLEGLARQVAQRLRG